MFDNEFYTEEELAEAFNLMPHFGIENPERNIIEFTAETVGDSTWGISIEQSHTNPDRHLNIKTYSVSCECSDGRCGEPGDQAQLDLIATALGFELGATKIHVTNWKASFVYPPCAQYPNGEIVTKHLVSEMSRKEARNDIK